MANRSAKVVISGSAKINNNTAGESGGGVSGYFGIVEMSGGEIKGNIGNYGGGLRAYAGSITITGGTVSDNTARNEGAVLYRAASCTVTIDGTTFTGNAYDTDITH